MRKQIIMLFVFYLLMISVCSASNEKDGFRDLKWGSSYSSVEKDMTHYIDVDMHGKVNLYYRKTDDKKFGFAEAGGIFYWYWQDKFYRVTIETYKYIDWQQIHNSVSERFGNPGGNSMRKIYWWNGNQTNITSHWDEIYQKGTITFESVAVTNEIEKWEKDQAKQGSNKF